MKDPNYKRQKKTLGLYLGTKLYHQIEEIAEKNNESRSATAKMLVLLGLNVYRASANLNTTATQKEQSTCFSNIQLFP